MAFQSIDPTILYFGTPVALEAVLKNVLLGPELGKTFKAEV